MTQPAPGSAYLRPTLPADVVALVRDAREVLADTYRPIRGRLGIGALAARAVEDALDSEDQWLDDLPPDGRLDSTGWGAPRASLPLVLPETLIGRVDALAAQEGSTRAGVIGTAMSWSLPRVLADHSAAMSGDRRAFARVQRWLATVRADGRHDVKSNDRRRTRQHQR
jgi:hypothetical protein